MAEEVVVPRTSGPRGPEGRPEAAEGRRAMPPAELVGGERLTPDETGGLSIFSTEHFKKKRPDFSVNLGTAQLWRFRKGDVICRQGDTEAFTAFYILTTEDALNLRRQQVLSIEEALAADREGREAGHLFFRTLSASELRQKREELQAEIGELERRQAEIGEFERRQKEIEAAAAKSSTLRVNKPIRSTVRFTGGFISSLRQRVWFGAERGIKGIDAAAVRAAFYKERDNPRTAATVLLTGGTVARGRGRGFLGRIWASIRGRRADDDDAPDSIPIDGPVDLQRSSGFQAQLKERDLFGEMSCLNRSPRSATVIASRDCYVLEMLRRVLDMLHADPKFKETIDENYRKRVLEGHVRRLSIFEHLTDAEFAAIKDSVQLVDFSAGVVILEEYDPSDAVYIIRSGMVKVLANGAYSLREHEFTAANWSNVCGELAAAAGDPTPFAQAVWKRLPPDVRNFVSSQKGEAIEAQGRKLLVEGLNALIRSGNDLIADIKPNGQKAKERWQLLELIDDAQVAAALSVLSEDVESWSEYDERVFCRYVLEQICPQGIPRRLALYGPPRVLSYRGRGDVIGEIGVVRNLPRSATCVAYDHPTASYQRLPNANTGGVPSRVEALRIDRDVFRKLLDQSARLREQVGAIVAAHSGAAVGWLRKPGVKSVLPAGLPTASDDFERLGLVQGQKLMLIDLDHCTRCGACVEACINAHSDGFSRLYLDGPRIENYLVPITCRKCLDPVCMIGCPVGAIHRGDNGEIRIRNWCIGCKLCAEQCPYGSIQMNDIEALELTPMQRLAVPEGVELKDVTQRAVVCDLCSSHPSRDPSCVYACPHDAAIRVNGQEVFLQGELVAAES